MVFFYLEYDIGNMILSNARLLIKNDSSKIDIITYRVVGRFLYYHSIAIWDDESKNERDILRHVYLEETEMRLH